MKLKFVTIVLVAARICQFFVATTKKIYTNTQKLRWAEEGGRRTFEKKYYEHKYRVKSLNKRRGRSACRMELIFVYKRICVL